MSRKSCIKSRDGIGQGKEVVFTECFVYEFDTILGDNPAVKEGCPIALGNRCVGKSRYDVETMEYIRGKPRKGAELNISVEDRAATLLAMGYELEQIVETVLEVERIKLSRAENSQKNRWEKLKLGMDSAGRTLRKIVKPPKPEKPKSYQARTA